MRFRKAASRLVAISHLLALLVCLTLLVPGTACHRGDRAPSRFGFGRPAKPAEIDSMSIAVMPDGRGLPPGSGDPAAGKLVYTAKCAMCHGANGTEGPFVRLIAPMGDTGKIKAIGNYWPYATTLFDYIRRAMPLNAPGTLSNGEVYGLTAWLLQANKVIPTGTVITASTLPRIVMPAKKFFVSDDNTTRR